MHFTKMQGLGNDYIYVHYKSEAPPDLSALAVSMSDRHFGVGADGLIAIGPGQTGDFSMVMYNADGSRGEMCGNGIRCLGKYVFDKGLTDKTSLTIDTPAGPRTLQLHPGPSGVDEVTVDMGAPFLFPEISMTIKEITYTGIPVSMGNPHFVIFCSDPDQISLEQSGPALECHPLFPNRTNVEFACPTPDGLRLRVWERGSGETLACGTGACAAFAAARQGGLCQDEASIQLRGGLLLLRYDGKSRHIFMTGPAVTVFEGEWPDCTVSN